MNREEYLAKRRQDPEYREVEKQLKPILDLADDVFNLRMERGWSQGELARRARTKQANISRLENGVANPTFKFLEKLGQVFETELSVRLRRPPVEEQMQSVTVFTQVICVPVQAEPTYYIDDEEYEKLFLPVESVPAKQRAA